LFHCINDKWVMFWAVDSRRWSPCDSVVWINAATECNLGCKYCHDDYQKNGLEWLNIEHLEKYQSIIPGKLCLTICLNDIFFSPHVEEIFKYSKKKGWIVNAYSFFPKRIDLDRITTLLDDYENVLLNWSLHRPTDTERKEIFSEPHLINDVLNTLKPRKFLNTIVIFSDQNPRRFKKIFNKLSPDDTCINFIDFINYKTKTVKYREVIFESHIPYRSFHPSPIIMKGFHYDKLSEYN